MLEINKIYNMNCLDGLKLLDDECIDLTITSPPYDNIRKYNGYFFDFENIAKELYRITKNGGVIVWVIADKTIKGSESGTSFKQVLYFKEIGFNLHDTMIYQKKYPIPQFKSKRYTNSFEYMFILSKKMPKTFNPIKIDTKSYGRIDKNYKGQRFFNGIHNTKEIKKVKKQKILNNIWSYDAANDIDRVNHPAQFPMSLAEDHILSWSNVNDLILDPFIGSGTVAKMAILNNRNYIGFEISEEYCSIAEKRIENI